MTREIKWRAFYKGKMRYWPEVRFKWQGKGMTTHYIPERKSVKAEVMQYTGLTDKNGVEVYEGDIVKIAVNPYHGLFEVKFGEYKLREQHKHQIEYPAIGWYLQRGLDVLSLMHATKQDKSYGASKHSIEVIGNVYESPELLKNNGGEE